MTKTITLSVLSLCVLTTASAQPRDFGVDVSHFQGASGVSQASWNQMYAEGRRFAFVKATEGLTGPDDAAMANNVARASAAGLLVGVYHYPHPENRPTTNGAVLEADHLLSYAGSAVGPGRLRPVLDLEGTGAASLTKTALTDWVIAFSDRIISQRGIGAAPIIYVNRSFARDEVDNRLANYDCWLAYPADVDWSTASPPPTASYPNPTGVFNNWSFWQYSSSGSSGGISPIDVDVCHSEYKPLSSYIIPHPPVVLANVSISATVFQFGFTNTPGRVFTVMTSTNPAAPAANWTVAGAPTEGPAGYFQFSDPLPGGTAQKYYRIRSP